MKIDELKTYDDLKDYLLERMDYADEKKSKANSSFTRKEMWNMYIGDCLKNTGAALPIRTHSILAKRIKKDFGQSL